MKCRIIRSAAILMAVLLVGSITACSKAGKQETNTNTVTTGASSPTITAGAAQAGTLTPTAAVTQAALSEEEQIRKKLVGRSLLGVGNNYRIKQVIEKAKRGEDVTLAFIGGSITEGYNAGTPDNFAKLTYEYFADTYGSRDSVHLVNAGLSGTPSTLGLIRSDRDIFSSKPDIIFIEFAVNDAQSGTDPSAFESLIKKSLKQDNSPAVILLFSVIKSGYTCQNQMALTAFHYKLPMISLQKALQPEFDAGRMTWADWSNDDAHPNEFGHKLYSEFIINYLKTVDAAAPDEPAEVPKDFVTPKDYSDMQMLDKTNAQVTDMGSFHEEAGHEAFPNGWVKAEGTGENKGIQFKVSAKSFFVVYKEVNSSTFGTADVYVDGQKVTNLAGNTAAGWNNPKPALVFDYKESAEHTVEIKMAAGDEVKSFAILALGVCP